MATYGNVQQPRSKRRYMQIRAPMNCERNIKDAPDAAAQVLQKSSFMTYSSFSCLPVTPDLPGMREAHHPRPSPAIPPPLPATPDTELRMGRQEELGTDGNRWEQMGTATLIQNEPQNQCSASARVLYAYCIVLDKTRLDPNTFGRHGRK